MTDISMADRIQDLEAERDRLRMILDALAAFDAGEPSKPPHTGKDRGALAKVEKTDE